MLVIIIRPLEERLIVCCCVIFYIFAINLTGDQTVQNLQVKTETRL